MVFKHAPYCSPQHGQTIEKKHVLYIKFKTSLVTTSRFRKNKELNKINNSMGIENRMKRSRKVDFGRNGKL